MPGLLRRARVALLVYFGIFGLIDGVWLARLPAVKQHLRLSDALLGIALLAAPAGLVVVAAFADRLIDRLGSARPTAAGAIAITLLPIALGLAGSMAVLMAVLLVYGMAGGMTDVAINAQAVRVERGYRRPIINSFHACFSFGGLLGALLGGLFAWADIGPAATFAAIGVPLAVVAVLARRRLLHGPEASDAAAPRVPAPEGPDRAAADRYPAGQDAPGNGRGAEGRVGAVGRVRAAGRARADGRVRAAGRVRADGRLRAAGRVTVAGRVSAAARRHAVALRIAALGLLALCSLLGEGAAGSWSAVYLRDNLGTSAAFAALGYAAFSVTMAAGRLTGDHLAARFGPGRLVSGCGVVAALGLAGALISRNPALSLVGFALFGAGLSSTFPQLLSTAGNIQTPRSGTGIARVAGAGYLGLLVGPVLIGSFAGLLGLRLALGIPVILMGLIAVGGRAVVGPRRARGRAAGR
ncbi:MAG TPA: MFS transporter [Streptosporangiaceae bacterium]|nr:MFS transporter [Streptosporangiaceae bacterium]